MDKVNPECAETVKAKPTGNNSGFITYSNTINVATKWLDRSGYLIIQWRKIGKKTGYHMVQKIWKESKKLSSSVKLVKNMTY